VIINLEKTLQAKPDGRINLFIGAVGYESRSTWLLENGGIEADKIIGYQFSYNQVLHFDEACRLYSAAGAEILPFPENDGLEILKRTLLEISLSAKSVMRVVLDISAMSRLMIATTLVALTEVRHDAGLEVNVHYTPARFQSPGPTSPARVAEPIIPELAGWSDRPDVPLGVLIGLGYEGNAAAGALQVLEPSRAWAFYPFGQDERFLREVELANEDLSTIYEVIKLTYAVMDPAGTRALLKRMLSELRADYRIALVPFGPKIFAWLCMLTALESGFQEVGVWRFSPQELGEPVDHIASGLSIWHQVNIR